VKATSALGLLVVALSLGSTLGCTNAGKHEAASLVQAVDAYRHASGPVKAQRAQAVGQVACTDAKVCDAKAACVAAIDPTLKALALKDEVTARVADLEKGVLAKDSPEAQALPGKLDEAERLLKDGRAKMDACDNKLTDLHIDYGV
jgi:hypothetical protein